MSARDTAPVPFAEILGDTGASSPGLRCGAHVDHPSPVPFTESWQLLERIKFIKDCWDYYETVSRIFVHAYYEPDLPLHQQRWDGLRWASLPREPKRHCSGKVAVVGHTAQESGGILDLGCVKCIDTFCHGGGWLTALEVETGRVWQANEAGEFRMK